METTYRIAVFAHVTAGTVALAAFWTAAWLRKGSARHRRTGDVFLLAMLGVLASGVPLVTGLRERGQLVGALFLGFLLVLVAHGSWTAWRAIRDRTRPQRFYGPVYWTLTGLCGLAGAGIVALGFETGAILLQAFGGVGVLVAAGAARNFARWRTGHAPTNWWLREHYGAVLGNGVATHIAFFSIGLRNALPFLEPTLRTQLTWFLPLGAAVVAGFYLDRRYGRGHAVAPTGRTTETTYARRFLQPHLFRKIS